MVDENWGRPKTPRQMIEHHATGASCEPGYRYPTGQTVADLVREGKQIPDDRLPGRFIMRLKPHDRELLTKLTAADTVQGGLWWCHTWKPMPEPRTLEEYVNKFCRR